MNGKNGCSGGQAPGVAGIPPRVGVTIVQPIVPAYRVPLFSRLARRETLDVWVHASARNNRGGAASVPPSGFQGQINHRSRRIPALGLVWQQGVQMDNVRGPGDVLVVCGDLRYMSNYRLITIARRRGAGVIWWGHAWSPTSRIWSSRVRYALMRRLADVVLVYSDRERDRLLTLGFRPDRLFATNNTLDLQPISEATAGLTEAARLRALAEQGLAGRRLMLFSSVLTPKTRLDLAIHMLASEAFRGPEWTLVVIGDGVMRGTYERLAQQLAVTGRVKFLGAITDQARLAPWFRSAEALVYPGDIGLSLLHAFAFALPVVTHDNPRHHGPEFGAMSDGVTGALFREGDLADLVRVTQRLVSDPAARGRMGAAASARVFKEWSMDEMERRFAAAIQACSTLSLARRARPVS